MPCYGKEILMPSVTVLLLKFYRIFESALISGPPGNPAIITTVFSPVLYAVVRRERNILLFFCVEETSAHDFVYGLSACTLVHPRTLLHSRALFYRSFSYQ